MYIYIYIYDIYIYILCIHTSTTLFLCQFILPSWPPPFRSVAAESDAVAFQSHLFASSRLDYASEKTMGTLWQIHHRP